MPNRAVILDANSLIVRCIMASALDDLKANGMFTGGIYGSLRMLRSILSMSDVPVDRVYAFFDHGVPPRRMQLIPGYKSARQERRELMSEEDKAQAFQQVDRCFELFGLLGVRCLVYRDREADDGVAAAVRVLACQGNQRPIVVSSDGDLLQTVRMGADVWDLNHGRMVTVENFHEITGVPLEVYTTYRALTGDTSDSVEGSRGCGPVRGAQLLAEVITHDADQLPPLLTTLPAPAQLEEVGIYLRTKGDDLRAWERTVLESLPRLRRVVLGIDLSVSFGPTEGLEPRLNDLPLIQERAFLQACKSLQMRSVLGDPEGYLRPFRAIQQRRLGKPPKPRV